MTEHVGVEHRRNDRTCWSGTQDDMHRQMARHQAVRSRTPEQDPSGDKKLNTRHATCKAAPDQRHASTKPDKPKMDSNKQPHKLD